jgi:hypothetical protein
MLFIINDYVITLTNSCTCLLFLVTRRRAIHVSYCSTGAMVDGGGSMEGIKTVYKRGKHSNK